MVLGDLHWADRATLDLIRYLTLTLGPARVLVLLTVRDEELRPDRIRGILAARDAERNR